MEWLSSPLRLGFNIIFDLCLLALLDTILRHQKRSWSDLGLAFSWSDLLHGLGLWIGSYLVYYVVHTLAWYVSVTVTGQPFVVHPSNVDWLRSGPFVMLLIYAISNSWFEELIVRAYTMTELSALNWPSSAVIFISVVLQTGYHVYQGIPSLHDTRLCCIRNTALGCQNHRLIRYHRPLRKCWCKTSGSGKPRF